MSETIAETIIREGRTFTNRSCGECSMCCKLLSIDKPELSKPKNKWCEHCRPGAGGCMIYDDRPPVCRNFACQWLVELTLDDAWYPPRARIVVHFSDADSDSIKGLNFVVDKTTPNRWREQPYYATIKNMARRGLTAWTFQTRVYVGDRVWVITPDKDFEVGNNTYIVMPTGPNEWGVVHDSDRDKMQRLSDFMKQSERMSPDEREASLAAHLEAELKIKRSE